jgi:hypothetical protein
VAGLSGLALAQQPSAPTDTTNAAAPAEVLVGAPPPPGESLHELADRDLSVTLRDSDLPPSMRPKPKPRNLTGAKIVVDSGTSLLDSVKRTHWRSRGELESFMQDYIDAAASEPDKQAVVAQATRDRETVRQQLMIAEADVLAGRWTLEQGKEHAQDQANLLKVPVPEAMKPLVATGQFLGVPAAKVADALLDFVPWIGEIKMLLEAITGKTVSGEIDAAIDGTPDIDDVDRVMRLFPLVLRGAAGILDKAPGWMDTLAKVKKGSGLSEEALSKALSDIRGIKGREQDVARALVAVREQQQAKAAKKLESFVAKTEGETAGVGRAGEPPPVQGGPPAGPAEKPPGPFRALATGHEGKVLLDTQMVTTLIEEHPDLAGIRSSLQQEGAVLVSDPALSQSATANVAYVKVTGPNGASFDRAVISYNPKSAVLQDLWHEMNHLLDFRTGKVPPSFSIAKEDATRFAELQGKGAQDLLATAKSMPKPAALQPIESAQAVARKWVAEIRNHLRDIEELPKAKDSGYVENARKAVQAGRTIIQHMIESGQVPGGMLDATGREQLKQFVRKFIDSQFPDLPVAYGTAFPRSPTAWKFLD